MAKEITFVSMEKERRAREIIKRNGVHWRNKHPNEPKAMEERAYDAVKMEQPDLFETPKNGTLMHEEELVRAIYEKLGGKVLEGEEAKKEKRIRERIKERENS